MSEEIKKDRSRNYPRVPLSEAIEMAKVLYAKAGKAKISVEVAAGALGYKGISGASLTTIGVLTQYGLIDRERGKTVSISPLAIRLIHPLNSEQELSAKRESALMPKVFNELYSDGFHKCDESVIANHLIQNEFTPDGAKKAASVFKANIQIANLESEGIKNLIGKSGEDKSNENTVDADSADLGEPDEDADDSPDDAATNKRGKQVLATYSIPLGANEATIVFRGHSLSPEDFDALADYVALFKKQYQRKLESEAWAGAKSSSDAAINAANATGQQ